MAEEQDSVGLASGLTAEQHLQGLLDNGVSPDSIRKLRAEAGAPQTVKDSIAKLQAALTRRESGGDSPSSTPVEAPESASTALSPEDSSGPKGKQEEAVTEAPVQQQITQGTYVIPEGDLFEAVDDGVELDFSDALMRPVRNNEAETDFNTTAYTILAEDGFNPPQSQAELESMSTAASEKVKQKRKQEARVAAEQRIANAGSQEDVIAAIEEMSAVNTQPVLISDLRKEEIAALYQPSEDIYLKASEEIAENMRVAARVQKAQDNLWDNTGWFDIVVDAVETISPTAILSERVDKARLAGQGDSLWAYVSMGGTYEDLAEKVYSLPADKRAAAVEAMIQEVVEQETVLFQNGNSLLQADQLELLELTLRDGFSAFLGDTQTGGVLSGEMGEDVFSTLDVLFSLSGVKGVAKGSKGLLRKLTRKLTPDEGDRVYAGSRPDGGHSVDNRTAADPIGQRVKQNATETPVKAVKDSGLPDYSAASRFIPVKGGDADELVEVVKFRGKYVPVDVASDLVKRVGKAAVDADELADTAFAANMRYVRELEDILVRGKVEYIPKKLSLNPKQIIDSIKGMEMPQPLVNSFVRAVDESIPESNPVPQELEWSAPDPAAIEASIRDIGQAQLVDVSEYGARELQVARTIERTTGSSLKHNPSMTVWRANDQSDSIGDFRIYFGDGDTGFKSKEMAETVGKNALGEDLKAKKINGRWYLEKEFTHRLNPRKDVGVLDTASVTSLNPLFAWFINPLRKLGRSNLVDVWGNIEINRSIASSVLDPAKKALNALKEEQLVYVSKLLAKGDEMQQVFTRKEALDVMGRIPSDAEYEAYLAVRKVFDAHYDILNGNLYKAMDEEGYKAVQASPDDLFYGQQISKEAAAEVGDEVFDYTTNSVKRVDELGDDVIISRTNTAKRTDDGESYTLVATSPESIKSLPTQVLTKRTGHVTRTYADRKFKVVQRYRTRLNGREVEKTRTLGIARLPSEAEDIVKALVKENEYDEFSMPQVVRTVENPADDVAEFSEDMSSLGYVSSNTRHRGDQLLGADLNPARVADPLESMALAQSRIERELSKDVVRVLEQKFMNTWGQYLTDPFDPRKPLTGFPREGHLKFRSDTPDKVQKQIRNFHEYVVSMDGIRRGKIAEYFNSAFAAIENSLFKATGRQLPDAIKRVIDGDAQRAFMKLATNAYIIGRPLFQIPTNLLQTMNIIIRYPKNGGKAAARALGVAAALAERNSKDFGKVWGALAKTGYSDEQLKQLLDLIDETGIVKTTGMVDDFIGLTQDGLRQVGGQSRLGRAVKQAGRFAYKPVDVALTASSKAQQASINFVNLVSLITEFDNAIERGVKMTAKSKSDILMRARQLTQTQNSLDRFGYQEGHNPLQMMFQFVQHVNKMFLDIAVEPYVKLALDRGLVKGNEGIYASTRGVAARTVGLTLALFGVNGLPVGSDVAGRGTNYLREMYIETFGEDIPDELWTLFQGGLINSLLNASIDGKVDVTARISPSAFVDMVVDMFNDLSMDVLGAAGGITESVFDIGSSVATLASTPDLDVAEKGLAIVKETASFFAGFKDYERAMIAKTWLAQPYMGTLSGPMRLTYEEAIFNMFSVNSKMVEDLYRNTDFGGGRSRSHLENVSRVMIRQMNRELTELKEAGKLDEGNRIQTINNVMNKWKNATMAHLGEGQYDEVKELFDMYMLKEKGEGFNNFLRPYFEDMDNATKARKLKRLREETQFQDYKNHIDAMLMVMGEK